MPKIFTKYFQPQKRAFFSHKKYFYTAKLAKNQQSQQLIASNYSITPLFYIVLTLNLSSLSFIKTFHFYHLPYFTLLSINV